MTTGRYSSGPFRTGKTKETVSDLAISDLLAELGSSYSTDTTSTVMAEIIQYAKAIEILFRANNKLGNLYQPKRLTTETIDRWSKALNIHHKLKASLEDKKAAIAAKLAIVGTSATYQGVSDLLATIAPNTFQSLTHTDWKTARSSVAGGVNIAGGLYVPPTATGYWSSVHHVAVKMAQPAWMADPDFFNETYNIRNYLDDFLPCWSTFDWYRDVYPYLGFTLADETNLDNSAFNIDNTCLAIGDVVNIASSGQTYSFTDTLIDSQLSRSRTGSSCVYYVLEISTPVSIRLNMTSALFDTYMSISQGKDFSATLIASNDDSGGSTNSYIALDHLPVGDYLVECTSYMAYIGNPQFTFTVTT